MHGLLKYEESYSSLTCDKIRIKWTWIKIKQAQTISFCYNQFLNSGCNIATLIYILFCILLKAIVTLIARVSVPS